MRPLILVLAALWLCSLPARANNTLDAGPATCTVGGSTSSCTVSYTTASGTTVACVSVGLFNNVSVATVSFNGSTIGWNSIKRQNDGSHAATTEIVCKSGPATSTTANVVVTMSTPPAGSWGFVVYSFSGSKTSSFSEGAAGATNTSAGSGSSVSVTTTVDGDWVIDATVTNSASSIAPNAGQTQIGSTLNLNGSSANGQLLASYREVHPAGTVTQGWTWTGGGAVSAIAAVGIEPASFTPGGATAPLHHSGVF